MKTTLKRGMGRGAELNGNGRAIYPPSPPTPMSRYRQPDPPKRGAWHLVAAIFLWTILAALIIGAAAGGAAYLKGHQFVDAISPKTKADIAAAKRLPPAAPAPIRASRRSRSSSAPTGAKASRPTSPGAPTR